MENEDKVSVFIHIISKEPTKNLLAIVPVSKSITVAAFLEQAQTYANKVTSVTIDILGRESKVLDPNEFDKTLSECGVVDYTVLKTENSDLHVYEFDRNKSKDTESASLIVPNHFTMGTGLNLIGKCNNAECEISNTITNSYREFDSWDPFKDEYTSCSICKNTSVKPFRLVFFYCKFKIKGIYIIRGEDEKAGKVLDEKVEEELDENVVAEESEWHIVEEDFCTFDFEKENDMFIRKSFEVSIEKL